MIFRFARVEKKRGIPEVKSCLLVMAFGRLWFCTGPALQKGMKSTCFVIYRIWGRRWIRAPESLERCMDTHLADVLLGGFTAVVVRLLWWWWSWCASIRVDQMLLFWGNLHQVPKKGSEEVIPVKKVLLAFVRTGPPWIRISRAKDKWLAHLSAKWTVLICILF